MSDKSARLTLTYLKRLGDSVAPQRFYVEPEKYIGTRTGKFYLRSVDLKQPNYDSRKSLVYMGYNSAGSNKYSRPLVSILEIYG